MTLILSGTDGLSDVDGSAATPAIRGTDANTGIFFPAADTIAFSEGGAEVMRIADSGYVGIGTTSPADKLSVVGSTNREYARIESTFSSSGSEAGIRLKTTGTNGKEYLILNANTEGSLRFYDATAAAERMRIDSSGNVGIGTSSPRAKLSVTNGAENTSGDAPQEAIITGANQAITTGNGILTIQSNTAIAADVGATIALGGRIRNTGTTTDASNFAVIKGAKENATSDNSAGYFAISTKPNGVAPVERMRIDSSGGLILAGSTAQKATGTTWSNPSDQRLKDNIHDYAKGTTELMQVRVREWEYNGKGGTTEGMKGLGVIADEVMTVLPNTVETYDAKLNADDEEITAIKKFDATEITWLLVKTVQEQQALITALTARIESLEAK